MISCSLVSIAPWNLQTMGRKCLTGCFVVVVVVCFSFFIRYFLHLHFKCYPKSLLCPSPALLPYPLTPTSWPWCSPVLGHIKFARPRGLSSQWWPTRPSSATYAARDMSSGEYWLVNIVVPPIGLQTPSDPWVLLSSISCKSGWS
jgi:hypothetical protein